eukprot:GEZU01012025.1.p1 GENE.GEZU01012025.1~~GEZU01012025.1.p1  ORF type:complete len:327 (-),score=36.46 GEZU01012025.1:17-916(-)
MELSVEMSHAADIVVETLSPSESTSWSTAETSDGDDVPSESLLFNLPFYNWPGTMQEINTTKGDLSCEEFSCFSCSLILPLAQKYQWSCEGSAQPVYHFNNDMCRACVKTYYNNIAMGSANLKSLRCMNSCRHELTLEELKELLDEHLYLKVERKRLLRDIWAMRDACVCPAPNCNFVGFFEIPKKWKFLNRGCRDAECPKCGFSFCTRCKQAAHGSKSCRRASKAGPEENQSRKQIKKKCRPCPVCHTNIEKNGGCRHMTCSNCSNFFCWDCMKPFYGSHAVCYPGKYKLKRLFHLTK